jgi:hypothetical protein
MHYLVLYWKVSYDFNKHFKAVPSGGSNTSDAPEHAACHYLLS